MTRATSSEDSNVSPQARALGEGGCGWGREVRVHLEQDGKVSGEEPSLVGMKPAIQKPRRARQSEPQRKGQVRRVPRSRAAAAVVPAGARAGHGQEGPFLFSPERCNYRLRTRFVDFT
jgi:hypothetical protein